MDDVTRRQFVKNSTTVAAGLAVWAEMGLTPPGTVAAENGNGAFASSWQSCPDRVWLGPEYWANPLQDWRIAGGRAQCVHAARNRNIHILTRQLSPDRGDLRMSVRIGRVDEQSLADGKGSAGFRIGIQGPLKEYRNSLVHGSGLDAGVTADGGLFIGNVTSAQPGAIDLNRESIELRLTATPHENSYTLTLAAADPRNGQPLAQIKRENVPARQLIGNLALVANFNPPRPGNDRDRAETANPGTGRFSFADWRMQGTKLQAHEDRAFGPILFSQYTLSDGVMKMTAQMPPIGPEDPQTVRLQIKPDDQPNWSTIAEQPIHPEAYTATFRLENWDATAPVPYRLAYTTTPTTPADGPPRDHHWTGTIRRDPTDQPVLTVADVSCNIHAAFPNHQYVQRMAALEPDLIAFVGDQFYESTGGYGVVREPLDLAILDYLRKWYMHGWTWRDLTRDRPSVSIPDDHDNYQGNIWGAGGEPAPENHGYSTVTGYSMPGPWVNVMHRTQTSHLPDPYDPTPIKQNISVYYCPMTYGRVSFAVIADRMFKSGPRGNVPPNPGRADHITDPDFDPASVDNPQAVLLGDRQLAFLQHWAQDWRGADLKALISQTIFTAMATHHGREHMSLRADLDTNAWPQTARNQALSEIRKCFPVHISGDQHLPALVHYGVEEHHDGPVAFAGPAVNVGYPRWFEPENPGQNRPPNAPPNTGDFTDHFGHPLTVLAVANGALKPGWPVLQHMQDKASGIGLVRFNKTNRTITFECWPYLADTTRTDTQFPGWPVTVSVLDNYARTPAAHLPTLDIRGTDNPVVQVIREENNEILYTLRIPGNRFQPKTFAPGPHTLRITDPDTAREKQLTGIQATPQNNERLQITI